MRRRTRFLIMAALLIAPSWSGPPRRPLLGARADIVATPLANRADGKAGALTYLGGVELTSGDAAFGGWSSMIVRNGALGEDVTLLSDGGTIARFRMKDWRISAAGFGDLPAGPANAWFKMNRDSESMTRDPATGQIWVGFERTNEIWRYSPGLTLPAAHAVPRVMRDWSENGGAESMVRLRDGRFLVIAETDRNLKTGARNTILFDRDPVLIPRTGIRFGYIPPAEFDPSDAAQLPDGRILVLNRRLRLPWIEWAASLVIVDPKDFRPGAIVRGQEIARIEAPMSVDNCEGLAITREGSAIILWIVSDDNISPLQRTLLVKYRLNL